MLVRMLRDMPRHPAGEVVDLPVDDAVRWIRAGIARQPGAIETHPPIDVDPDVEILNGPATKKKHRMAAPRVRKGA